MKLADLGWGAFFEAAFEPHRVEGLVPARVAREDRQLYIAWNERGEWQATLAGRLRHHAATREDLPVTGDWVGVEERPAEGRATIQAVLPRKTCFRRRRPGPAQEVQVVAANVETAFVVNALDGGRNFSLRRTERYLALVRESGAEAVILLNKADLCADLEDRVRQMASVAGGAPVLGVSAITRQGLEALSPWLGRGRTAALLGPSGVGKSALINALLGEERRETAPVREDDLRGRHTTTARELSLLPAGGLVLDTPGMREIQPWGDEEAADGAFEDVAALALRCRFRDCRHQGEPGCAVQQALSDGELDPARYENYLHIRREMAYLARRADPAAQRAEKQKWKAISKWIKEIEKKDR